MDYNNSNASASFPHEASVSGTIEFFDVREPILDVTVYVRVQDAGLSDASARTVAEQVLRGVNIVPGAEPIPFNVQGIPENPHARYVVRVHADVDGNGVVSRGDYVSTQSHPVLTDEDRGDVSILARPVG